MKQIRTRLFSALLVCALLLTMGGGAWAADSVAPSHVSLNAAAATLYLHNGAPLPLRLTATVQPSDFDGTLSWTVSEESKLAVASSDRNGASITAAADAAAGESGKVTVTATGAGVSQSAECTVTIKTDTVKAKSFGPFTVEAGKTAQAQPTVTWLSGTTDSAAAGYYTDDPSVATVDSQGIVRGISKGSTKIHVSVGGETLTADLKVVGVEGISLDRGTLSMSVGDNPVTLKATVRPAGLSYTPVFTTSDASVAVVSSDGKVTAKGAGAATITARITDSNGAEYTASCTVSVNSITGDVSDSTGLGTDLSLKKIYSAISTRFTKAGGSGNPTIAFSSIGSSSIGTLYETSARTKTVQSGYYGSLSLLENMYFVPAGTGRYLITYSVTSSGKVAKLTGTITIEVTSADKNIHISLPSGSDYVFTDASGDGATGVKIVSNALGGYGSIRFGSITSGSGAGTLYTDSSSRSSTVRNGTVINSGDMGALYYTAGRNTAFRIEYTAYSGANGAGNVIASGTLIIGSGADSLNVTVSLDSVSSYRFTSSTRRSSDSGAELLRAAIDANTGSADWKYVKFESEPSVNTSGGKLYTDTTADYAVNDKTYITSSDLDNLYFVPTQAGSFEIGYSIYTSDLSAAPIDSGKLRIVASNLASGTAALYLSVKPSGTLTFRDSDFENWYIEQRDSNYHLEYITINSVSRSFGTLYQSGTKLTGSSSYNFYAEKYFSKGTYSRYITDLSFTAPSRTGYQEITFTCYGRRNTSGSLTQNRGVLRIYAVDGEVPDITYSFGNASALALKESDFIEVYRSAMGVSTSSPSFYIQLMGIPGSGTLYENYSSSTARGTELTSSTVDIYPYYINGGNGTVSVSKLTYVPSSRTGGVYPINYIAFSADGEELYGGRLIFKYNAEASTVNVTDGHTFTVKEVCGSADGSDVRYVVFDKPLMGKLYLNYTKGRGTPLESNVKLYASSSSYGAYPITALTYIPTSEMDGSIELGFTAYTASRSYSDKLTLKVNKKTASATFPDVTAADVGSWAGNAIDYASKWGLVIGTGGGKFSPSATMRRCDLVLILYRNAGEPAVTGTLPYTDVPEYYTNSALWASQKGIMDGVVTGNKYNPNGAITRQDFTRILYNYTKAMGGDLTVSGNLNGYTDANRIASYAKEAMTWAVGKNYIKGMSTTTLGPTETATRAQIATLLHRYLAN